MSLLQVTGRPFLMCNVMYFNIKNEYTSFNFNLPNIFFFFCNICQGSHFKGNLNNMTKPKIEIIIQRLAHTHRGQKLFRNIR